ncbi:MAG: 6-phosphogluconolactonase, partial [Thermoanaerobaculia bacterium]
MSRPRIRRFPDLESLASGAAEDLADCVERAIREAGRCRIAMAGGSTPRPVYRLVAGPDLASRIEWDRVHVFWGDERCVPPTDPASNYRMVHDELLARVPIPERNVHRIEGERSPDDAARAYAETLGDDPMDLVLLGMGGDGHT